MPDAGLPIGITYASIGIKGIEMVLNFCILMTHVISVNSWNSFRT